MPTFIQNRFSRPEIFRMIQPDLLVAWLKQAEGYFSKRGVFLPGSNRQLSLPIETGSGLQKPSVSGLDYDNLARVFMEPTPDMPAELLFKRKSFRAAPFSSRMPPLPA